MLGLRRSPLRWSADADCNQVGATSLFLERGYTVDLMMAAFHGSKKYINECDSSRNGDVLRNGRYFGSNIHPYETLFIKANRDIDPNLINHLTEWHLASGTDSWAACGRKEPGFEVGQAVEAPL
jgi:hypothetical protein